MESARRQARHGDASGLQLDVLQHLFLSVSQELHLTQRIAQWVMRLVSLWTLFNPKQRNS
jgi:hypothetical protein